MSTSSKSLATTLDDLLQVESVDGASIIATLRHKLESDPELIKEILPAFKLVKRPMSNAERAKIMVAAAAENRRNDAIERNGPILALINEARRKDPDITLRQLGALLDASEYKPFRARKWSAASINNMLKAAGDEPTKT